MALIMIEPTDFNVDGDYWKVIQAMYQPDQSTMAVRIGLFKDKQSARDGAKPLKVEGYQFVTVKNDHTNKDVLKVAYEKIKVIEMEGVLPDGHPGLVASKFANATDDLDP
jgi:hypothetical protein